MFICICNSVTETEIRQHVKLYGCVDIEELGQQMNVGICCGMCRSEAERVVQEECETKIVQEYSRL